MAIPHAKPGDVIDVCSIKSEPSNAQTRMLIKTDAFEVIRMVMSAGKTINEHQAPGEITVQCLAGKIAFTALGKTEQLVAGQMLYLKAGEPHSVHCLEEASFLLTIILKP